MFSFGVLICSKSTCRGSRVLKVKSTVAGLKMPLDVQWHSNNNFVIFLFLRINNGHNNHMVRVLMRSFVKAVRPWKYNHT